MENSELLPCPFCGGEARYGTEEDLAVGGGVSLRYQVYCGKCLALCDSRKSERAAITAWNTRTQPRVTVEEVVKILWSVDDECRGFTIQQRLEWQARALKAAHPHLFKE